MMEIGSYELFELLSRHAFTALVVAALVALVVRRVRHAAVAHALWVVVLLKLLTPSFLALPVIPSAAATTLAALEPTTFWTPLELLRPELSQAPAAESTNGKSTALGAAREKATGVTASRKAPLQLPWASVLLAAAAVGSLTLLGLTAARTRRFRRLLGVGEAVPPELSARLAELARDVGLRRAPRLKLVREHISPMVWPRPGGVELVLPLALLERLRPAQLDAVLVHELAHLKRRDHWVRLLELLATALFWWHPVTWWARRNLRRLEERCCDAWVAHTLPGSGRDYAEGLLKTLELLATGRHPLPATASGLNVRHEMKERLTMILTERTPKALSPWHRGLLALLAVALLVVLPTHADRGDDHRAARHAVQQKYASEELTLERRALELRGEMAEIDAERERLAFDRDMELGALEFQALEARVEQQAATGNTTEAELGRLELEYRREEMELRRRQRELGLKHLEELEPLERAARLAQLEGRQLALTGQNTAADRFPTALKQRKERLHELQAFLEAQAAELRQAQFELQKNALEERLAVLTDAGHNEEAVKLQKKLDHLIREGDEMSAHREFQARRLEAERAFHEATLRLEEAKRNGDTEAARQYHAALELMKARQQAAELQVRSRHEAHERRMMAEKLAAQAAELREAVERAEAEERAQLEPQMKKLEAELKRLKTEN